MITDMINFFILQTSNPINNWLEELQIDLFKYMFVNRYFHSKQKQNCSTKLKEINFLPLEKYLYKGHLFNVYLFLYF